MCLGSDKRKRSVKLLLCGENVTVTVFVDDGNQVEIIISINAMIEWLQGKPLDQAAPSLTEYERYLLTDTFKESK